MRAYGLLLLLPVLFSCKPVWKPGEPVGQPDPTYLPGTRVAESPPFLTGIVRDGTRPLSGARVRVSSASSGSVLTGLDGRFEIDLSNVRAGRTVKVTATRHGYAPVELKIRLVPGPNPLELELQRLVEEPLPKDTAAGATGR